MAIISLSFLPHSPIFLLSKGLKEEAVSSLKFFRGGNVDVSKEIGEMEATVGDCQNIDVLGMRSILSNRMYLKPGIQYNPQI